jgi:hypothetical protein
MSRQPIKFSTLRNQLGLTGKVTFKSIVLASGGTIGSGSNQTLTTTNTQVNAIAPYFPVNSTIQLWANSLSTLTNGASMSNWGNFTQATVALRPTFNIDSGTNVKSVRFTGTSSTNKLLRWNTNIACNYGTNGGVTYVLVIRYNSTLLQFNRTLQFEGSTGNGRVYEFILAETGNNANINQQAISPKHYYANAIGGSTFVPLYKWTLIVSRFTNATSKHDIFINNMSTPVLSYSQPTALQNSTLTSFMIGASGNPGQNADIHFHAMYPRSLSASDMSLLYNSFSSIIQL